MKSLPAHVRAAAERAQSKRPRVRGRRCVVCEARGWIGPCPHAVPAPVKPARRGVMNGTEQWYAQQLDVMQRCDLVRWWAFEPITLRLASGARYTPDFAVIDADGSLRFVETKGGFIREAAMVRLKVAAALYPHWRFLLVQYVDGQCTTKEIRP